MLHITKELTSLGLYHLCLFLILYYLSLYLIKLLQFFYKFLLVLYIVYNISFYIDLAPDGFDVKPGETNMIIDWQINVRKYFTI